MPYINSYTDISGDLDLDNDKKWLISFRGNFQVKNEHFMSVIWLNLCCLSMLRLRYNHVAYLFKMAIAIPEITLSKLVVSQFFLL